MAYQPTLADIEEFEDPQKKGGFVPTLADIPQQPQHSPLQALLTIGGGIAQGAESANKFANVTLEEVYDVIGMKNDLSVLFKK